MSPGKPLKSEIKYYGWNACLALWRARPDDVIRAYVHEDRVKELGPLLKWCATHKRAYHVVDAASLERVAASTHHEGVVLLARAPRRLGDDELVDELQRARTGKGALLYLDSVQNPHNFGALLRTAAHFGVSHVIGAEASLPSFSPSAMRVAEGGLEHVRVAALQNPPRTLAALERLGYRLVATSGGAAASLYETTLPAKAIFALGNEVRGLSRRLENLAALKVRIPGSGHVESLNVGVAGAVVLAEWWRQTR